MKIINFRTVPIMLLAMLVGIVIVAMSSFVYGIVFACVLTVICIIAFFIDRLRLYKWQILAVTVAVAVAVISSSVTMIVVTEGRENVADVTVIGRISSDTPFLTDGEPSKGYLILDNVSYSSSSEAGNVKGKVMLKVPESGELSECRVGDYIEIFGSIVPNPVVVTDGYSMADYAGGIAYNIIGDNIKRTGESRLTFVDSIRVRSMSLLSKYMPDGTAEIMYSMIFGEDANINSYDLDNFRAIGISHLFAVSGLHIGVLAGAVSWLIKKCKGNKYVDYFASLGVAVLYGVLTGFGVSVARAIIMLAVYKTGRMFGYRNSLISSVSLAGVIILAVSPFMLFTLSFQMSMLAIIGMSFFSRVFTRAFNKIKVPASIAELLALSLSVNLALLPIMLAAFGDVSLIFLIANLLLVPVMAAVFPVMLLLLALALAVEYAAYLLIPIEYIFKLFALAAGYLHSLPFLLISAQFNTFDVILYLLGLTVISPFVMTGRRVKYIMSAAVIVVFSFAIISSSYYLFDSGTRIGSIYSYGGNDCIALKYHGQHYLVLNGEFDYKRAEDSICGYMESNKIARFDGVIKAYFSDSDAESLRKLYAVAEPNRIITNRAMSDTNAIYMINYLFGVDQSVLYTDGSFSVMLTGSTVMIEDGDINVAVCDVIDDDMVIPLGEKIDILYANGDYEYVPILAPKYFVSDYGIYNNIPYSIESHFTFVIKNDKIKVR